MTPHRRWLVVVTLTAAVSAAIVACGSDDSPPAGGAPDGGGDDSATGGDGNPAGNDGGAIVDAGPGICDDASPDADIDCTGKCGPVRDLCTGVVKQCGGCPALVKDGGGFGGYQACDLDTNTCGIVKNTCKALGAECGTVKNSCGEYLDCPDGPTKGCPAGKECDPDTHKCRDCQPVTCQDLGIECGSAWLGCGPNIPANYTDCGGCSDAGAQRCNAVFHVCEPSCKPKSATVLCNEAKAKKGLECGVISNGCGGTVNCDSVTGFGCKNGESCGVRGIANRCDPKSEPDECEALGRSCGEITSVCTGKKIKCGDCATGQVCNSNGVCGEPCTPKTCADFSQFQCGTFDDGCRGTISCGTCANGVCNNATKSCCATNTCNGTYGGKCGQDLPNGCGQNTIDCPCSGTAVCTADGAASAPPATSQTGLCCTPHTPAFYANQCGTNLADGCGGTFDVACPSGSVCVNNATGSPDVAPPSGVPGTCCTRTDTCNGQPANQCSAVQNSCRPAGVMVNCDRNCTGNDRCLGGTCCTPAAACSLNGDVGGECNVVKPANGCGQDRTCDCNGGLTCWCGDHQCVPGTDGPGSCKAPLTCGSGAYSGKCGTGLDNGIGNTIDCPCPTGRNCDATTPGTTGQCQCANGTGAPYTCGNVPGGPGSPGGDQCGAFDDGCGGAVACGCPGNQVCNTTANPNVCCSPASCPAKAVGSACGNLSNNCGGTISCGCPSGAGNENFTCTGGTCHCVPDTCRGRTGPQPDRCGGTLQCTG